MVFFHDEKVFSLSKTAGLVPYDDITQLFSELFSYLIIAGLFDEATNFKMGGPIRGNLSDNYFSFGANGYRTQLGKLIANGLKERLIALRRHPEIEEHEIETLRRVDTLFNDTNKAFLKLAGREFTSIADRRNFEEDFKTLAHYAAVMFGQEEFPAVKTLPKLYISVFGNIHLAKHSLNNLVEVEAPTLIYGKQTEKKEIVTALWSLISAQVSSFVKENAPGDALGYYLDSLSFFAEPFLLVPAISMPRYASALMLSGVLELDGYNPIPVAQAAYNEFLYGSVAYPVKNIILLRTSLAQYILDVMMEKVDIDTKGHLFSSVSYFHKLFQIDSLTIPTIKTPVILEYALESLDATTDGKKVNVDTEEDSSDDVTENKGISEKGPTEDPETDDGGYDSSVPPPAVPVGVPSMEKNTIGLISFDKTGEGIDEDLYRSAVVALNDRIQKDDDVEISADVKDSLNYWVNGYVYRAAVTATKERITSLGLQKYLKNI